jgi:arylsulfatase A-like enzyme
MIGSDTRPAPPSRREFLRGAPALASAPSVALHRRGAPTSEPNVILLICDQMRGDAMSGLGNPNCHTPNLDRMARNGVLFENCFANNPVCIPSRKTLFSGLYPHQHGSLTNQQHELLGRAGTMLGHFLERGYRTGYVGKNHTFVKAAWEGVDQVNIRDREPFRQYNRWVPPNWYSATYWPKERCHPHLNTEDALRFLGKARRGDRFFLTVSYFDPHPPYFAPSDYLIRRHADTIRLPRHIPAADVSPRLAEHSRAMGFDKLDDAELKETMRHYHAAVEWGVDHQVGRILDALDKNSLVSDTVVVFVADHGDFMGHHRMVRKGMLLHDGLLHVPMIWYAPGRIAAGVRVQALAQLIDVYPTLADLTSAGAANADRGSSLKRHLVQDHGARGPASVFTSAAYGEIDFNELAKSGDTPLHTRVLDFSMNPRYRTSVVRTAEWKLVLSESRPPELFHMNGGRIETANVAEQREFAGVRQGLEKQLTQWWKW